MFIVTIAIGFLFDFMGGVCISHLWNWFVSPASAEGTWVMCKDPNGSDVKPVYIEPRVIVSPFDMEKHDSDPDPKTDKKSK